MKRLLFILFFALVCSGLSVAQGDILQTKYPTVVSTPWQLSSIGCNGFCSFYWGVTRSVYADKQGYYYYDVWFYSNSVYNDGRTWSWTKAFDLNITIGGRKITHTEEFLFQNQTMCGLLRVKSHNAYEILRLTSGNIQRW